MKKVETKTSNAYGKYDYDEDRGYQNLVPYEVLDAAISGDTAAIYEIVRHFGGYIVKVLTNEKIKANEKLSCIYGRIYFDPDDEDCMEVAKIAVIQSFPKFRKKY